MRPPGVFRPDIEGLRAIAIVAVVLYHPVVLPSLDPAYSSARGEFLKRPTVARTGHPRMIGPACKTMEEADTGRCAFGKPGGTKRVVLYGDSHAEHLFGRLNAAAVLAGWELRVWVRGGCSPIDFETNDAACTQFHHDVYEAIPAYQPGLIVVASANGGSVHLHERVTGKAIEKQQAVALWKAGYKRSLERLSGIGPRVVVVRDTPGNSKPMGTECLETRAPASCVTPRSDAFPDATPDADVAATVTGIGLLDLTDRFCASRSCPAMKDGVIVYRADNNHITAPVSLGLAPDFAKMLEGQRQGVSTILDCPFPALPGSGHVGGPAHGAWDVSENFSFFRRRVRFGGGRRRGSLTVHGILRKFRARQPRRRPRLGSTEAGGRADMIRQASRRHEVGPQRPESHAGVKPRAIGRVLIVTRVR
jgi:hypothetical protein